MNIKAHMIIKDKMQQAENMLKALGYPKTYPPRLALIGGIQDLEDDIRAMQSEDDEEFLMKHRAMNQSHIAGWMGSSQ